jgi:putative acetyltransferase
MMKIRRERKVDYPAVHEIHELAFEGITEARLVTALRNSDDFIPELSLVAVKGRKVVGHILFSLVSIETQGGGIPALTLAPMAVAPEYQNQGIGSDLVRRGLQECLNHGHKIVLVIGHPDYYPRFGFEPAIRRGLTLSFSVPDEAFMVIELVRDALEGIHGEVCFPSPFDEVI